MPAPRTIYFDYNATTPLDARVRDAMLPFLGEVWGNPSSVHHVGRQARAQLDDARDRISKLFACKPSEIIFTSGGTESNNLALLGAARALRDRGRHIITTAIEHHAVLHPLQYLARKEGFEVTLLPVDATGLLDPADLKRALRPDTILVSVMSANNEIGTLQPVAEIGRLCRAAGILFHTDAVQSFGKLPFTNIHQFEADLVTVCAHKFHGPKGAGLLYLRSPFQPDPIVFGGAHENEKRAGTENVPAIMGLTWALELFVTQPVFDPAHLLPLTSRLEACISAFDFAVIKGNKANKLANTISFTVKGTDSAALIASLDMEGICASSGSACSSGSLEPSHVILALGADRAEASALVRFSLGRESTAAEVAAVEAVLPSILRRVQLPQ